MKIALVSDIHSNLEALEECVRSIDAAGGVEKIVCLGDIVGYGADPAACTELVAARADITVLGNHDAAVTAAEELDYFNYVARDAIVWTQHRITGAHHAYLSSLPYTATHENLLFTHATPDKPEAWMYIFNQMDSLRQFDYFTESVCFIGHSHIPGIYGMHGQRPHDAGPAPLEREEKYLVNIGSVGQPRDGNPRLSFAFFDTDAWTVEIVRREYDVESASRKIRENGLPLFLSERILVGR